MNAGIELMLVGMGLVFLFLVMLIVLINWMALFIQRFAPEPPAEQAVSAGPGQTDAGVVAAISAAIRRYRTTHKS